MDLSVRRRGHAPLTTERRWGWRGVPVSLWVCRVTIAAQSLRGRSFNPKWGSTVDTHIEIRGVNERVGGVLRCRAQG